MSEKEINHETVLSRQPLGMNLALESTAEYNVPQTLAEQHQKILPAQQALQIRSKPWPGTQLKAPTNKPRSPTTRANWVNTLWADISGQLRRFSVISSDLFDGLLLKKDTTTGLLIVSELRKKYEQLGNDRDLASVRVLSPEKPMDGLWQLLWTIKRHRDPNGRQFHSNTTIDPIGNQSHLQLESNPSIIYSVTDFSLPPFIQDYGPGPSEFDPEPADEFDMIMQGIMTDVDGGTRVE